MNLKKRLELCWRILRAKPGKYLEHADRELPSSEKDDMQLLMNQQLKEMLLVFSTHGHSGFSASYARSMLNKLLALEPILPLTGEESEWGEPYDEEGTQQNIRCSSVFRRSNGTAYHSDHFIFGNPDFGSYTSSRSRKEITFPYTPHHVRILVDEDGNELPNQPLP